MTKKKPTVAQKRAILAAIDNGGRISSDPYQLRTITALIRAGWMVEPDGRTLEVTSAGRAVVGRPAGPAERQRRQWVAAVTSPEHAGLTIRQAEQATRDAAHAEALTEAAERDANFTHLTQTGVPHLSVCGRWAVDVPITTLARKATCPQCVPSVEIRVGRG